MYYLSILFLAIISFLIGFTLSKFKQVLFDMEDSPEMIIQAERCFKYNFSTSSLSKKSYFGNIVNCSMYKNDQGKIVLLDQTKPSDFFIF